MFWTYRSQQSSIVPEWNVPHSCVKCSLFRFRRFIFSRFFFMSLVVYKQSLLGILSVDMRLCWSHLVLADALLWRWSWKDISSEKLHSYRLFCIYIFLKTCHGRSLISLAANFRTVFQYFLLNSMDAVFVIFAFGAFHLRIPYYLKFSHSSNT